jgi:hypothetical protein
MFCALLEQIGLEPLEIFAHIKKELAGSDDNNMLIIEGGLSHKRRGMGGNLSTGADAKGSFLFISGPA